MPLPDSNHHSLAGWLTDWLLDVTIINIESPLWSQSVIDSSLDLMARFQLPGDRSTRDRWSSLWRCLLHFTDKRLRSRSLGVEIISLLFCCCLFHCHRTAPCDLHIKWSEAGEDLVPSLQVVFGSASLPPEYIDTLLSITEYSPLLLLIVLVLISLLWHPSRQAVQSRGEEQQQQQVKSIITWHLRIDKYSLIEFFMASVIHFDVT